MAARLTEDEEAAILCVVTSALLTPLVYFGVTRPLVQQQASLLQLRETEPAQAEAVYAAARGEQGRWWRDTCASLGAGAASVGLSPLQAPLDALGGWLGAPLPEGSEGAIVPVAVSGCAQPTARDPSAVAVQRLQAHLDGLPAEQAEAVSTPQLRKWMAATAESNGATVAGLDGQQLVLRRRRMAYAADCAPILTPLSLVGVLGMSPTALSGRGMNGYLRLEQPISQVVSEVPWALRGGAAADGSEGVLHVQRGSFTAASNANSNVQQGRWGLPRVGEAREQLLVSGSKMPLAFTMLAIHHFMRTTDRGIPVGARVTVVGGLTRTAGGQLRLCAHPTLGFGVPTSLQEVISTTGRTVVLTQVLAALSLAAGVGAGAFLLSSRRHYAARVWEWLRGRRGVFPDWDDPHSHEAPLQPLELLRRALAAADAGEDVEELEIEPGVFLGAKLAGLAGPGVTTLQELRVEDDEEVMGNDAGAAELRCSICLHNRRAIMCLPCRHVATCIQCMVVHTLRDRAPGNVRCPICVAPVDWIQRVYL